MRFLQWAAMNFFMNIPKRGQHMVYLNVISNSCFNNLFLQDLHTLPAYDAYILPVKIIALIIYGPQTRK